MSQRLHSNRARRTDPTDSGTWMLFALVLAAGVTGYLLAWGLARLSGTTVAAPIGYLTRIAAGADALPAWIVVVSVAITATTVGLGVWVTNRTGGKPTARVDVKAASMAQGGDLREMLPAGARTDAERLGALTASEGVPVARLVPHGQTLRGSWEWVQTWIMGPRAGKTTCVCVRQVVETTGPVVATTNKRDLVDFTRGLRGELGNVWVFDPQDIIGEPVTWWWNPLTHVTGIAEAEEMAGLFFASAKDANARTDAYFDTSATSYLAALLLAAAVGEEPITTVQQWASRPDDDTPIRLLQMTGHERVAVTLRGIMELNPRQRDGVIGTASSKITWLSNPQILPWITPQQGRREFQAEEFVRSRETLYLVSREGRGTARAVTAALTVATTKAAERHASHSPNGRLPVPMMVVLDEAANVVRWPDLPDLYSHFGSRGILLSTFLQSWNQGVEVWGRDGMEKLWSASNVAVVGSGLKGEFLDMVSRMVSDHDVVRRDVSRSSGGKGSRSVSTRVQRERILEPGELRALPRNRAVMMVSGAPAALVELVHWSSQPYAEHIAASHDYYSGEEAK